MSRIRTIYNEEALLVGPSPATGIHNTGNIKRIHRLQSLGMSFDYTTQNVNEYGKLAAIDRVNVDGISAPIQFSYLVSDFENEKNLGFVINSNVSAVSDFLNESQDDRNYFRAVAPEGTDAEGVAASGVAVIAVGNAVVSSYSFEASVGAFPTATVSAQGINVASYLDGVANRLPSVDPLTNRKASGTFTLPTIPASNAVKPSVIQPGDIRVNFSNTEAGIFQSLASADLTIQSITVDFDLQLEDIKGLGNKNAKAKKPTFPVDVNVKIEALFSDLIEANLVDLLCQEEPTDITIDLYNNDCDVDGPILDDIYAKIIVKNARISNEDLSGSIGPSDTVSITMLAQIGAANDSANGVFFSGVYGYSGVTPLISA